MTSRARPGLLVVGAIALKTDRKTGLAYLKPLLISQKLYTDCRTHNNKADCVMK